MHNLKTKISTPKYMTYTPKGKASKEKPKKTTLTLNKTPLDPQNQSCTCQPKLKDYKEMNFLTFD